VGAGDARSDLEVIPPCDTLVHFVGVTHPNPSNLGQFREIDLESAKELLSGVKSAGILCRSGHRAGEVRPLRGSACRSGIAHPTMRHPRQDSSPLVRAGAGAPLAHRTVADVLAEGGDPRRARLRKSVFDFFAYLWQCGLKDYRSRLMDTRMVGTFDLERYLRNSKKVDISDIDLSQAAGHPLTEAEVRCLTYMMDIESHTIVYLRSILSTCAIEDPDTTAFLSCWAYEEHFHGRTIGQFLNACGIAFGQNRLAEVQRGTAFTEWLKDMGASLVCQFSRYFHGAYLTYGAISELSTLEGYGVLARRTQNPLLADILRRLAKDERRHFSFYYNKAKLELQARNSQRLTTFIIKHFWLPVGGGVKPDAEVNWILNYILKGSEGEKIARRIDETIAKLPGLGWFKQLSLSRAHSLKLSGDQGAPVGAVVLPSS
jgi:hypothetical protein